MSNQPNIDEKKKIEKKDGKCANCGQPIEVICRCEVDAFRDGDINQGSES